MDEVEEVDDEERKSRRRASVRLAFSGLVARKTEKTIVDDGNDRVTTC